MKRLQSLQNACVGFVTRRFTGVEDAVKLNWLLVNKNVELNIFKLAHKSLYDKTFPEYLKSNLHKVSAYSLRPSITPVLSIPKESKTFQHSAATIFNKLPVAITNITEYNSFCRTVKIHFLYKELKAANTILNMYLFYSCIVYLFISFTLMV